MNSSTLDEPILIRLSILGKPFKSDPAAPDEEPVVFCFTMVQAKGPRTIYSTCGKGSFSWHAFHLEAHPRRADPKQAMPVPSRANRAPTLPMSSHSSTSPDVPTSYFQGSLTSATRTPFRANSFSRTQDTPKLRVARSPSSRTSFTRPRPSRSSSATVSSSWTCTTRNSTGR